MSRSRRFIIAISVLVTMSSTVWAISRSPAAADVVRVRYFDLTGGHGRVFIIVRKDGEVSSHRYVVEARPTCGTKTNNWRDLPIMPITAACHIDAASVHFDASSNSVMFEIFRSAGADCKKESEPIRFPLTHLCDLE